MIYFILLRDGSLKHFIHRFLLQPFSQILEPIVAHRSKSLPSACVDTRISGGDFICAKVHTVSAFAVKVKRKVKVYTLWGGDLAAHAPQ